MSKRFEGKVALVAGGANANEEKLLGFPGLSALEIARGGGSVVIGDINDDAGRASVEKMVASGLHASYVHLDVTSETDWQAAVDAATSQYGRLDIMIMAAGMPDRNVTIESADVETWRRVMDVTNLGMFFGVRTVVAPMRKSGGGSIVLISSMVAKLSRDRGSAYETSRAGMTQFAKSAAVQFGPDNIRVNTVLPGWAYTPFSAAMFDDERMKRMSARVPLRRIADASDIAGGILFLASDEARYMTGAELVIDGGVTAWIGPV